MQGKQIYVDLPAMSRVVGGSIDEVITSAAPVRHG